MAVQQSDENQKSILLADDNPINREMVKKILENYGFRADTASDGEETLEKIFQNQGFDLILLDINMPKLNGLEVAAVLKKSINEDIRKLPIIALTGNDTKKEVNEIFKAGINSYIAKPVSPKVLIDIINKTIKNPCYSNAEQSCDIDIQEKQNQWMAEFQCEIDVKKGTYYVGNDPAIFKRLLFKFYVNYKDYMEKIISYIEQEDEENSKFSLHSLKGTSAQICANNLHNHVKKCEQKVKADFKSLSKEDIENMKESFDKVIDAISGILQLEDSNLCEFKNTLQKDLKK